MQKIILNRTQREYISRMNKVIQYINDNLDGDFSLDALADVACFSPFHFHRIFKAFIGETPNDYVKRLRLEKAAGMLLLDQTTTIADIAYKCGFSSQAIFARAFKERFGVNATDWKTGDFVSSAKNSKNSKTDSKNGKDSGFEENYFAFVESYFINKDQETLFMKIEVKNMPAIEIAYVAILDGYDSAKIGAAYGKLCSWAGPKGLMNQNTKFIGMSWDDPTITDENKCRYYSAISVPEGTQAQGEIGTMKIEESLCAVGRFEVLPDEFSQAYKEMFAGWLPMNGYIPTGQAYEIYYGDPDKHPEHKFVFDLCVPVKSANS